MSIVRVEHSKEKPFVVITRQAVDDHSLSWGARGLLCYLIGRPDNWTVSVKHLSELVSGKGGGRTSIYSMLKELIENGYCSREQKIGPQGRFTMIEYVVYEFKKSLPHSGYPNTAEPLPVDQPLTNNDSLPSNEKEQQQKKKVASAPVVVSSSSKKPPPDEEAIKNAEFAANQYIESQTKKGLPVDEKRIRRQALNEKWVPNKTKKDLEREKKEAQEKATDDAEKRKKKIEKIVAKAEPRFTNSFYVSLSERVVIVRTPKGSCPIAYADTDSVQQVEYYLNQFLDGSG